MATHNKKVPVRGMLYAGAGLAIAIMIGISCRILSGDKYKQNRAKQEAIRQEYRERLAKQPVKVWKGAVGEFEVYIEEYKPVRQ